MTETGAQMNIIHKGGVEFHLFFMKYTVNRMSNPLNPTKHQKIPKVATARCCLEKLTGHSSFHTGLISCNSHAILCYVTISTCHSLHCDGLLKLLKHV